MHNFGMLKQVLQPLGCKGLTIGFCTACDELIVPEKIVQAA
jgi:hypothetical protein